MKCINLMRLGDKSSQWPQISAVLSASLLAVISGNHMAWPSPSVTKLLNNDMGFSITQNEISIVVMIAPLGFLIGAPVSGLLLDKIGRKKTLLLLAFPHIISWLVIATSTSPVGLYVGRVFSGISDGGTFTCLPIYFAEILEPKVRGTLGVTQSTGILVGMLLVNIYGSYTFVATAAYISLAFPLLFLVTFIWMPDSPYFLVAKGHKLQAEESLKRLRWMHNVDYELTQLTLDVQHQLSEPSKIKDIFCNSTNLKAFLILLLLRTFQQTSGITAFSNYLQVIFERANTGLSPTDSAIIVSTMQIVFIIASGYLLDKFGRRPLLTLSYSGTSFLLIILGLYFYMEVCGYDLSRLLWLPITAMMIYYMTIAIGAHPIPNLMNGELLSASVKSKALGLLNVYTGVTMSASSKLFQWLEYDYGMHVPFFTFASFCVAGAAFSYFYVPETKGKTLEEVQQVLRGCVRESNTKPKISKESLVISSTVTI